MEIEVSGVSIPTLLPVSPGRETLKLIAPAHTERVTIAIVDSEFPFLLNVNLPSSSL